jgi:hypothetical protein
LVIESPEVARLELVDDVVTRPESPLLTASPKVAFFVGRRVAGVPGVPGVRGVAARAPQYTAPSTATAGAMAMAGPESPESLESPLSPLVAVPPAVAVRGSGGASWASALSARKNSTPAPKTAPMARLSHRDEDMCLSFVRVGWIDA